MKINLRRSILLFAAAFVFAGCGSASAPPVDLPAPITGYIDVSEPDGEGNVTITGGEGSVEGDSIVLVVNESQSASLLTPILDAFVTKAWAEDYFPEICSREGHACTMSNSNGEFVLVIQADYGDLLTIGLINYLGDWISEISQMSVPSEPEPEANCSGLGLLGETVDLVQMPSDGTPILLKQGSDTTTNTLVIGKKAPFTEIGIEGCYAHSLALYKSSGGTVMIVATSSEDYTLWKGIYDPSTGALSSQRSFVLEGQPMHVAFADSQSQPIVALLKGTSLTLARVSLYGGGIVQESSAIAGNPTRSLRVATQEMSGGWLGMLLADKGTETGYLVVLFDAKTMGSIKGPFTKTNMKLPDALFDANFWIYDGTIVRLVFAGDESSGSHAMMSTIMKAGGTDPLTVSDNPSDAEGLSPTLGSAESKAANEIQRIAVSADDNRLITTGPSGGVYVFELMDGYFGITGDMVIDEPIAAGHDFIAVSLISSPQYAFVADATAGAIADIAPVIWPPAP
ncbi:MAG TPA: hypothetical protein PLZ86_01720 [bacterium]|nr:hypothetical protein [bacterium]